ncbi:MAG: response regulator [Planctomycetota bacterium]
MPDAPYHILLIDDDPDMHDVVRLILPPPSYRVTCCATTAAGSSVLGAERPDALLLDIMLATPTEGLEFARRLEHDPQLGGIPIILISSAPLENPGQVPAGVAGFIEKPLQARDLREFLREVLR